MFKYSLFICKCSERESHFDCHFDWGCRQSPQRKNKSNLSVHKQQYTDAIRNSLGHLSSLTGALKIHEIFIGQDLVVKKKMLPNDPFYKAVLIKESRKKSAVTNILDDNGNDPD